MDSPANSPLERTPEVSEIKPEINPESEIFQEPVINEESEIKEEPKIQEEPEIKEEPETKDESEIKVEPKIKETPLEQTPGPVDAKELAEKLQAIADSSDFTSTPIHSAEQQSVSSHVDGLVAPRPTEEDAIQSEEKVPEEAPVEINICQEKPESSEESEIEDILDEDGDPKIVIYGNVKIHLPGYSILHREKPDNRTLRTEIMKDYCVETVSEIHLPKTIRMDVESYYWENTFQCPKCPGEFNCTCKKEILDIITKLTNCFEVVLISDSSCTICLQIKDLLRKRRIIFCQVNIDNQDPELINELKGHLETIKDSCGGQIHDHWSHVGQDENCAEVVLLNEKIKLPPLDYVDVIVIGANSAALAICEEAESCGINVCLIDFRYKEGSALWGFHRIYDGFGVALKKFLLEAAHIKETLKNAKFCGIENSEEVTLEWNNLRLNALKTMNALAWHRRTTFMNKGVFYVAGKPKLVDRNTVEVQCRQGPVTFHGKYIIFATECDLVYDYFPGFHNYCYRLHKILTYRSLEFGKTLLYGSTITALEYGGTFSSLGFDVTIMMSSKLRPKYDADMIGKIREHMAKNGVEFVDECRIASVMPVPRSCCGGSSIPNVMEKFMVIGQYTETGKHYRGYFDNVIVIPKEEAHYDMNYGLKEIGVKFSKYNQKLIEVDRSFRTSVTNIYAVGNMVTGFQDPTKNFGNIGRELAKCLSRNKVFLETTDMKYQEISTPVKYAFYGLSEELARSSYKNVVVYHTLYDPLELSLVPADRRVPCYMKLICTKQKTKTGEREPILGLHVVGCHAVKIVKGYSGVLSEGFTKEMLDDLLGIDFTCAATLISMNKVKGPGDSVLSPEECCS